MNQRGEKGNGYENCGQGRGKETRRLKGGKIRLTRGDKTSSVRRVLKLSPWCVGRSEIKEGGGGCPFRINLS